jgi:hypothetical protein
LQGDSHHEASHHARELKNCLHSFNPFHKGYGIRKVNIAKNS